MDLKIRTPFILILLFCVMRNINCTDLTTLPTSINVAEDRSVGSIIFICNYSMTTSGSIPVFNIASGNQLRRFSMDAQQGFIYLGGKLDRENTASYVLLPRVTNVANTSDYIEKTLTINIDDVNDNPPNCTTYSVLGQLDESAAGGTVFATLTCSDVDLGTGGQVEFVVISGNTTIITVDKTTGKASINSSIDYDREQKDFYSVNVQVKDKGIPSLTSEAVVMLYLRDVDDNPPNFISQVFTGNLSENSQVGTTVLTVTATDADSPNSYNSLIVYETVSCQPDWLMVDRYKGDIIIKDNVDYETSKLILCNVSAYSSNKTSNKNFAIVNVTVIDVNDRIPTFDQVFYKGNATENSTNIGALVVRVNATDPDNGNDGKILYSIDDPDGLFTINSATGEVTVSKAPDYEVKTSHLVTVYAEDQGATVKNKNSVFVQITIDPVNEFQPTFNSSCSFSASEDKIPGDVVYRVNASDLDAGMDGALAFGLQADSSVPFRIDSSTGDIRVSYTLDYETKQSYTFNVTVHDNSTTTQKSSTATCTVSILNVNDSDVICKHVPTQVLTAITPNTFVAQLICNDSDTNGIALVSYGLCGGNDDGSFQVSNQGLVSLQQSPKKNQYELTVCVYDKANLTSVTFTVLTETTLTIQNLPATVNVVEDVSGMAILKVNACCAFPNVVYSILSGNEDGKVTINSATGQIGLTVPYDREIQGQYVYVVQAKADRGQTVTQNLTVTVEDVNDNPPVFDSNVYEYKIVENYPGSVIMTITATDKDAGQNKTITYSISTYSGTVFSIDSAGTLTRVASASLDYETQRNYTFEIIAADGGVPSLSGSATVYISILNVDEFNPTVVLVPSVTSLDIAEDAALGTPVFQVQGADNDTGTTFVYSIISGNTNSDFVIDPLSGNITTWRFLDRETTPSYVLVVSALNQNGKSANATMSVKVTDVNDCNPTFYPSVYVFYVPHNWNSPQLVGTLNVTDADEGVNAQIATPTLIGTNSNHFTLSGLVLSTNVKTDYLSVNYYKLTVVATDAGTPPRSSSAVVIVYVSPASDTPKFNATSYTVSVPENVLVGSTVFDFNATMLGARENGSLSYSIVSGDTNSDFLMRASSGQLIIQKSLNYEVTESYDLVINAIIIPTPPTNTIATCTLTVSVVNINDNAPIFYDSTNTFEQETFSFTVDEGTVGSAVGTVLAKDRDKSPYGTVTESLSNTTKFSIDPATGVIKVIGNLDYTEASYYYLMVNAVDSGSPPLTAMASVVIRINDINNNSPVFVTASSTSVLDSTPAGSEIFRFHATDKDTGDAGVISYLDTTGSLGTTFELNSTSGVLKTLTTLDAMKTPTYTLTIQAKDKGAPVLSADQTFTINVISTVPNNNDPVFQPPYTQVVQRTAAVGTSVITVSATDADIGTSGQLVHTIASGNTDGYFIIAQSSGEITTATSVMSAADSYALTVVATDLGNPPRSANTTVTITVSPPKTVSATPNYVFTAAESATGEVGRIAVDKVRTPTSYTIASGNVGTAFSISMDPTTKEGILSVTALDYETLPIYSMEVNVDTDIGVYTKIVEVQVTDKNDNPPVFPSSTITLTIPENLPVGHTVETISATDADVTLAYRTITLAFTNPGHNYFNIDQSGHLTVKVVPDYETWTTETIIISATDQVHTSSVTVVINLIDVKEQQDVSTSSLTNNALISLEVPYQATSGHLIDKLTAGDFGINVSSTANIEFVSYKSDVPFSIDSYSGELTVTGSPALENHAKYFMWVLCRTRDGSATTSQISLIRVDTFDLYTQAAVIEFIETYATVYANREAFRVRAQMYFSSTQKFGISNIIDNSGSSRRRLLATNTVAYTYVVSNTQTTNDMANVNQDKTFLTDSQILSVLQQSSDGSPVNGLSDPNFLQVSKVMPYQESQQSGASEFVSSPGGIVMFCLLALLLLLALAVLIACLCYRKKKRNDQRRLLEEKNESARKKEKGSGFFFVRENSEPEFIAKKIDPPPTAIHSYKHKTSTATRSQASVPDVVLLDVPETNPEANNNAGKPEDSADSNDKKTAAQSDKEVLPNEPQTKNADGATSDLGNKEIEDKKKVPTQKAETNNNVSIIKNRGKKFSGTSVADSTLPKKAKGRPNAGRKTSPSRRTENSRKPKDSASGSSLTGEKNEPVKPEISDPPPSSESAENLEESKMEEVSPKENEDLPEDGVY